MKIFINLYKKHNGFDPVGWFLAVQQRGGVVHAAFEIDLEDGSEPMVWTTGARWTWKGPVFGAVVANQYNQGRTYWQAEFVKPLHPELAMHLLNILRNLANQRYGFEKVGRLIWAGNTTGDNICQLGKIDQTLKNPFCSEGVVFPCWRVGKFVCQRFCKKEPSVCTPMDLWNEAKSGDIIVIKRFFNPKAT